MQRKSYHIELDKRLLSRHLNSLKDIQLSIEEMAESRKIRKEYDGFLTAMGDLFFIQIQGLEDYLFDKFSSEGDK